MLDRTAQGFAASPVSSTTAADVSSQDVSIPRISIGDPTTVYHEDSKAMLRAFVKDRRHLVMASGSNARLSDSLYGGLKMPRSVMMPVMKRCGVTSNAGFQTSASAGDICEPPTCVTSRALRSSIGMPAPSAVFRSMVDNGAAT